MFRKIVEAAKEDAADDVFPKIPSYLEDFQKNKNLMSLGLEFQIYAIRNPIFKKKFDRSKALNHEELAAGLKGIFARQKLVPKLILIIWPSASQRYWMGSLFMATPPERNQLIISSWFF